MTTPVECSDQDKADLNYERYNHPHPLVQQEMEVLWLKSQGLAHHEICRLAAVCPTTLTSYLLDYREGGVEGLKTLSFRRPRSVLEDHRDTLEACFREHPLSQCHTSNGGDREADRNKARAMERVRVFMKKMGMKRRKVGMIPAKADIEAQEDFKKTARAAPGRSQSGALRGVLRRCRTLRFSPVSGHIAAPCAPVHPRSWRDDNASMRREP